MTASEIEENKRHATFERETAIATKKLSLDEIAITFRWIMASLLAINSASLAVSISSIKHIDIWQVSALAFLVLGVLLSLQVGWSLLSAHSLLLKPVGDLIVYWTMAAIDGQIDYDEHRKLVQTAADTAPKYGLPRIFAYLSLLTFAAGVACMAMSHSKSPQINVASKVEN